MSSGRQLGIVLVWAGWLSLPSTPAAAAPPTVAARDHFEKKVRPLLAQKCWQCHGAGKHKGGLRLDTEAGLARGGDSGFVISPGQPERSLLIQAVRQTGDLKMPPKGKLSEQQIADLVAWIKAGAPWPGASPRPQVADNFTAEQKAFWAFQPVKQVKLPAVKNTAWPASPIDYFLLAKLEEKGLTPAPPADKRTLLRRLTFDLTGLPPTPADLEGFLQDHSRNAFARVVNRLLNSPQYGERWGRHWLDVVRYSDTTANDGNFVMRYAWRYRDYIVTAFNRDKPYDQFLIEQLAGDLLPPTTNLSQMAERIIATGFLMIGPKALAETDKEQCRLDIIDDQIDVIGRAFLGLTLACARCHDHKFDPIRTRDYYSLAGILRSTEVFRDEVRNATMWQEWPLFQLPGERPVMVMAPKEGKTVDLRVHIRGNRFQLGTPAARGFPHILAGERQAGLPKNQSGRLELARWIAARQNPLTARVMANRLWQWHFGQGLVATSDNFGMGGEKPSHPELLDWLASRFADGWSIKAMHRLLVLSSAYQMASTPNPRASLLDPNNRLLSSMPRRRLDAEELRDALLAVSGRLDPTPGGKDAGEYLFQKGEVIDRARPYIRPNRVAADDPYYRSCQRRSLYLPVVRNALPDVLALFDAADPNSVTALRNETTVPGQALFMLNNPFVREQALHLAQSLLSEVKRSDADRLATAHVRTLGRPPLPEDQKEALRYVIDYMAKARAAGRLEAAARLAAWQSYCQMLFCTNEFLYVD